MCSDALEDEPECVPLLLMRARALIALRRDLDAQADLRDVIRLEPPCGIAYRLLGELAARRDENESAAIFFREAIRLDPSDREAADWLLVVDAAGRRPRAPVVAAPPPPAPRPPAAPRFARGTYTPDGHEGPTARYGGHAAPEHGLWKTPAPVRVVPAPSPPAPPPPAPPPPARVEPARPRTTSSIPEHPAFGEYLVASGILTRERLRAAQAYQRSMRVQLSTAIVTLGLATPQRIEWAAVAHQSQLSRDRQHG